MATTHNVQDLDQIWLEGRAAYCNGDSEDSCPYQGLEAEHWHDGWEDAAEDEIELQKSR